MGLRQTHWAAFFFTIVSVPTFLLAQEIKPGFPEVPNLQDSEPQLQWGQANEVHPQTGFIWAEAWAAQIVEAGHWEDLDELRGGLLADAELLDQAAKALAANNDPDSKMLRAQLETRSATILQLVDRVESIETTLEVSPGEIIQVTNLREKLNGLDQRVEVQLASLSGRIVSIENSLAVNSERTFTVVTGVSIALLSAALAIAGTLTTQRFLK